MGMNGTYQDRAAQAEAAGYSMKPAGIGTDAGEKCTDLALNPCPSQTVHFGQLHLTCTWHFRGVLTGAGRHRAQMRIFWNLDVTTIFKPSACLGWTFQVVSHDCTV